jgi:uncharacterized membrane protein SpoIIM required for sporulation
MVFESLLTPKLAEGKPWIIFFLGLIFSSCGVLLGNYIFPNDSSLAIVFLTTLFFIPLFYFTMIYEEEKDLDEKASEISLIKEHSRAIIFFSFLFFGMTLGFMFWSIPSPITDFFNFSPDTVFRIQGETIDQINAHITGKTISVSLSHFSTIFSNNMRVMIFCILFSFIYGAGAIFIITWNSSVIGLALGRYFVSFLTVATGSIGFIYLKATGCSLLRYLIHGIPEIIAYFIAGLAGGIISAAIIRHHIGTIKFEKILVDAAFLIIIAMGIILISAFIEVFITPLFVCSF